MFDGTNACKNLEITLRCKLFKMEKPLVNESHQMIKGLICPFGLAHPSTVPSSCVQVSIVDFYGHTI